MMRMLGAGLIRISRLASATVLAPILALALAGCSDAPAEETAGSPPNPLLYEIASADGTVEGWMLGTIHALPSGTRWRTPAITRVAEDAEVLVVEIADLDNRTATAAIFTELGQASGSVPLSERVPPDLGPAVAALQNRSPLGPERLAMLDTWAAALSLAQLSADADPANGVDRALLRDFAGRPIRELEGARAQLSIFDRLPETQQRKLLASIIAEADPAKDQAGRLRRAWLAGDAEVIEKASRTGILTDPKLRDALLVGRNRAWVDAILPMLEASPRPLIAVGAAHLLGSEGLVGLLQERGYRVRRLP